MTSLGERSISIDRVARMVGGVVLFALLVMLLFPRARRDQPLILQPTCAQQLKAIGTAVRRYAVANDQYPTPSICSPEGTPLLSWRVSILPYLGEGDLYRRFRLNESWDSPHNISLLSEMPSVYRCPVAKNLPQTQTTYLGITGPHAVFVPSGPATTDIMVTDPLVYTILVAEFRDRMVPWTKPVDVLADEIGPVGQPGGIGSEHSSGGFVLCCDGHVHILTPEVPEAIWRSALTRDGAEKVAWPTIESAVE